MGKLLNDTNIVIINDFNYIEGGASKVAIDTANLLAEKNKNINVYFFSGVQKNTNDLNEKVINICTNQGEALKDKNKIRGFLNGLYNFKSKKILKKLLKKLDKEKTIIHIHGWTKSLTSSIFDICFNKKYKVVLTLHDYFSSCPNGGYFNYKKNEICNLNPLSPKCIKCNCDSRNYYFKIYRLIRQFIQTKIVKLPKKLQYTISISDLCEKISLPYFNKNIINRKIYNPIYVSDEKTINPEKNKYYLYVGRISKEKGVESFCKVITKLNFKGIVVGDGSEKEILEKKYPNINFVGWKTPAEVKEYMKKAKLMIFPSLWYETAGLTILEAQAIGLPVLVRNTCAGVEFIPKENTFNSESDLEKLLCENKKFKTKKMHMEMTHDKYFNKLCDFYTNIITGEDKK